jgi:hypothetical protein
MSHAEDSSGGDTREAHQEEQLDIGSPVLYSLSASADLPLLGGEWKCRVREEVTDNQTVSVRCFWYCQFFSCVALDLASSLVLTHRQLFHTSESVKERLPALGASGPPALRSTKRSSDTVEYSSAT